MKILRAYKYRMYPTPEQQCNLARQFGASRYVFNHFLRVRIDYYTVHKGDSSKKGLTYHDTAIMLTALKQQAECTWLKEANAQALQQALRDLDVAYNNFFNKRTAFPTFKSKRGKQVFRVPQGFRIAEGCLVIPKVTPLRIVLHRPIEGQMKQVTISKTASGRYYASILCEVEQPAQVRREHQPELGIDLGLSSFLVASDGMKVPAPRHLRKSEQRLKRLQRRLSRCVKGSRGRSKARLALVRQHEKVQNRRMDFLHKLSLRLIDENQAIYLEDLAVKNLLRNHTLAKSISDAGWAEFIRQLRYKGTWYGTRIGQVDRFFPSTKRCHVCGWINESLSLKDRHWTCPQCGTNHDRDLNAARNILLFGRTAGTAET